MTTNLDGICFGTTLIIESWEDPVGEVVGVDARSAYVERFWLPFLGPSTTWLLRHVALELRESGHCELDVADTARALGLGGHPGRHGAFLRCVARAVDYEMAAVRGPSHLAFRRRLPPLPPRLVARLPKGLESEHVTLIGRRSFVAPDALALRGRQLALSLLELGENVEEAERQLLRWRFDPPLARRCARWAASQRGVSGGSGGSEQLEPVGVGADLRVSGAVPEDR